MRRLGFWILDRVALGPVEAKAEAAPVAKASDRAERIEAHYLGKVGKGLTPGVAVSRCIQAFGGTAAETRGILASRGIVVEDARQAGLGKRWGAETKPTIPAPKVERKPKPMVAESPKAEPIRAEWSDGPPCVMEDPRDALKMMPGYGKPAPFISARDLYRMREGEKR